MWAQYHPSLPVVSLHTSMDYPAPIGSLARDFHIGFDPDYEFN